MLPVLTNGWDCGATQVENDQTFLKKFKLKSVELEFILINLIFKMDYFYPEMLAYEVLLNKRYFNATTERTS